MEKKQTIILLHGNQPLTTASGLTQGELAVYNASSTTESAIYSKTSGDALVTFPSKDYVDAEITKLNVSGNVSAINQAILDLQNADNQIRLDFVAADSAITEAYQAADSAIEAAYKKADSDIETAYKAADSALQGQIDDINETIEGINSGMTAMEAAYKAADSAITEAYQAADSAIEAAYKKADSDIETAYKAADSALQTSVNSKVAQSDYDTKVAEIEGDIDDLESVLSGYTSEGSVKAAVDSKADKATYEAKVAELESGITANANAIAALNDTYATDDELAGVKSELEGKITEAGAKATTKVVEGTDAGNNLSITSVSGDTGTTYTINLTDVASASGMTALNTMVTTLVGNDSNKSVRTIANEELAAQLLSGDADADFKTLQDLAAWLEEHPESAAAMNAAISANTQSIADEVSRATSAETALQTSVNSKVAQSDYNSKVGEIEGDIDDLESVLSGYTAEGSVKAAVDSKADKATYEAKVAELESGITANANAIAALNDTYATDDELAGVKSELEGKITANTVVITETSDFITITPTSTTAGTTYDITTSNIAKADDLTALTTRVKTAEDEIGALQAADTAMESAYKAADSAITEAYQAADSALKSELNTEIAKKANTDTVTGINTRLTTVEGAYVTTVAVNDTANNKIGVTQSKDKHTWTLDFSQFVIDGGTYA